MKKRNKRKLGYYDITVAHAKGLPWIIKFKKRNDHVDLGKVAMSHLVDMISESHLPIRVLSSTIPALSHALIFCRKNCSDILRSMSFLSIP